MTFRQFLSELEKVVVTPVYLFIWFASTLLLTISGPFGTFENMPYGPRATFWLTVTLVSILTSNSIRILARHVLARQSELVLQLVVSTILTIVIAPVAFWVLVAFQSVGSKIEPSIFRVLIYDAAVMYSIGVARFLFYLQQKERPRLLARLPEGRSGRIIRMTSKGHYVEVVTDKGSEQIRMRFSDALIELNGINGARVHRSHWVARAAVAAAERENGRVYLQLIDGSRVPVSRGYMDEARAAGLVDNQAA